MRNQRSFSYPTPTPKSECACGEPKQDLSPPDRLLDKAPSANNTEKCEPYPAFSLK